jgi:signal transduction histidine kinase
VGNGRCNAEHGIYDHEVICDYPQSGERILGRNLEKHRRNAFRHARADSVEVMTQAACGCESANDGKSIAKEIVEDDGRSGHWGLHGMRERAKIIGENLEVWSGAKQNVIREVASWHCNFVCLNGF